MMAGLTLVTGLLIASTIIWGIISLIIFNSKRRPIYKFAASLPGPATLPLIGNALLFLGDLHVVFETIAKLYTAYPSPFRLWLGPELQVLISDVDQIKEVLFHDKMVEKHNVYFFGQALTGSGLLTAHEDTWRVHRKIIAPSFNSNMVRLYSGIFCKQAKILAKQMEVLVNQPEFSIGTHVNCYTLNSICESAMGIEMNNKTQGLHEYHKALDKAFEMIFTRVKSVWLHPNFIYNLTIRKELQKNAAICHKFSLDIIRKKKSTQFDGTKIEDGSLMNNKKTVTKKMGFLDILMSLTIDEGRFTETELRDEVNTMVIAGNDTTGTIISFVMLALGSHPEVQEKVYQELYEIYGDDDEREITYEDVNGMAYMERVIKETMRLFPITPVVGRMSTADVNIGGHLIPKGVCVVLGIFSLHRNPKHWTDPLEFDPDRFLPEEVAKRHPHCYLPFLIGSRNCPGAKYAMILMKVLMATMLRKYRIVKDNITPLADIKLQVKFLIKPVEDITMRIEYRKASTNI